MSEVISVLLTACQDVSSTLELWNPGNGRVATEWVITDMREWQALQLGTTTGHNWVVWARQSRTATESCWADSKLWDCGFANAIHVCGLWQALVRLGR